MRSKLELDSKLEKELEFADSDIILFMRFKYSLLFKLITLNII